MKDILDKVNRNDGMKVPDGYFDDFAARMAASLPEREWERSQEARVVPLSLWQRVRPYVYMAAMFMGVWCMMKTFDLMRPHEGTLSIDSNPSLVAALGDDEFMGEYMLTDGDVNQYDLWEDLYEEGYTPASWDSHAPDDPYKEI